MQIEITGFSVPPCGLFSSLRAVSLHAATTSRARLDEAAHNRTTQRAIGRIYDTFLINGQERLLHQCDRYCERERRSAQLTMAGCLARDRLAAREGVPRNKIFGKKKMMDLAFCITVGDHPILALPFSFGGLQFS